MLPFITGVTIQSAILIEVWLHAHWSVALTLTGMAVKNILEDTVILIKKKQALEEDPKPNHQGEQS